MLASIAYTEFSIVMSLIGFTSVLGCGQFPQGEVRAINFTASGFTLPAEMVYSENAMVQSAISSISRSREAAMSVIRSLIMNAVNDVLQEQGRIALLSDAVTSLILQQLNVTIEYTPLNCPTATNNAMNQAPLQDEFSLCSHFFTLFYAMRIITLYC